MEIIFDIVILCDENNSVHSMLRRKFEHDVIPQPGMKIEDPAWEEGGREPIQITLKYESNYCHLRFQAEEFETIDQCDRIEEAYRSHGWRSPSEIGI
jgi:hypothetical protein